MDNIKKYFNSLRNSYMINKLVEELTPTFDILKSKGGYKIVVMALILDILLIPLKIGLKVFSSVIEAILGVGASIGVPSLSMITTVLDSLEYVSAGAKIQTIVFFSIYGIIALFGFIITTFYLPNGAFNSFKIYLEENRIVTIKEFFNLCKLNVKTYISSLIKIVVIPLVLIYIAGRIINFIPFIAGIRFASFATAFIKYALLFKLYSELIGLDGEDTMSKYANKWFLYAIFIYTLGRLITSNLIIKAFDMIFILFTLLVLYNENSTDKNLTIEKIDNNDNDEDFNIDEI